MTPLRILQGNDVYVKVAVEVKIKGASPTEETYPLVLNEVSDLEVNLINILGEVTPVTKWAISTVYDNILYLKIDGTMECGAYGLEIKGKKNGDNVRTYYPEAIWLVYTDDESDSQNGLYDGFDCYEFNDPMVVQFSGVVFPYFKINPRRGRLYVTNVPDGGNFRISNGHLIARDYEGY
jgi:hypothetical protein